MIKLIPDWRLVLRYAWSVKLIVLAGILTGIEAVLPFFPELFPWLQPGYLATLNLFIVMGALVARFVAQSKISGDAE